MSTTLHEYEREVADDRSQNDYWAQTRRNILERWVADINPDSILDVGCGSGYLANYLGSSSQIVAGIDIERESINLASNHKNINLSAVADAKQLPFASDTFDCILLGDVIEHFEDPLPVLGETNRVLAQDGALLVSVPAFRWLWGPHDEHNNHAERYTASQLSDVVAKAGFTLNKHRYTNFFPLPVFFMLQRVFRMGVPSGARGGHNPALKLAKKMAITIELNVKFPIGITLLAKCSLNQSE